MKEILDYAGTVMDIRQEKKVLHKMADIILLVFFATLANADDWVEIEMFGKEHEDFLQNYLELPNGIPSHDTLQRVFAMVPTEFLESNHIGLMSVEKMMHQLGGESTFSEKNGSFSVELKFSLVH